MKNRTICKTLAVAVILLFIILGVKPAFAVTKYGNNNPPESPMINGPVGGKVGYEYEFFFSAVDPEGDNVSFYVEWGDGTNDGWSDYVESGLDKMYSHIWFKPNDYFIRCKAKDIYGKEIEIEVIDFIRDEVKFTSIDHLIEQISKDVDYTKQIMVKMIM